MSFGLVVLALLLVGGLLYYRQRSSSRRVDEELPPLIFPDPEPQGSERRRSTVTLPPAPAPGPPRGPTQLSPGSDRAPGKAEVRELTAEEVGGDDVEAGPVRFRRVPEGTLQLLPGRLEILSGEGRLEEIRFVKLAGRDAVVTFGRARGEPHAHVQLEAPTVSRMHARMLYQQGSWHLANLSKTNPVRLNGEQMAPEATTQVVLNDGDKLEMGEVVFRFRAR